MPSNLKPCPFCGEHPTLTKNPMWQGSHGYYGCYGFSVKCENENCTINPFTRTFDTIYEKDEKKQKEKAASAWNRRAQPENEPLTLEELRGMHGEPVWTVTNGVEGSGRWELLETVNIDMGFIRLCNAAEGSYDIEICTYGKTWLAYRSKPKEEV